MQTEHQEEVKKKRADEKAAAAKEKEKAEKAAAAKAAAEKKKSSASNKPEAGKEEKKEEPAKEGDTAKEDAAKGDEAKTDAPKEDAAKEEAPKEDAAKEEAPKEEAPTENAVKEEAPKEEEKTTSEGAAAAEAKPDGEAAAGEEEKPEEPIPPLNIEFMVLDLESFESTMKFVEAYKAKGYPLHVLICNAGFGAGQKGESDMNFSALRADQCLWGWWRIFIYFFINFHIPHEKIFLPCLQILKFCIWIYVNFMFPLQCWEEKNSTLHSSWKNNFAFPLILPPSPLKYWLVPYQLISVLVLIFLQQKMTFHISRAISSFSMKKKLRKKK